MNTEITEKKTAESEHKKGIFDSAEIKGLSSKSARAFSSGKIARAVRRLASLFAFTTARVYGCVFLSFGMLTLFLHLGEYYIMQDPVVRTSSMVIGIVFVLLSFFLLFSDKPICTFFRSSKILDFIVYDFFLINRIQQNKEKRGISVSLGMLIGFLLSVFGFFFPTEYAVLFIIGFIFVSVSFVSPEFPYLFSLIAFPYIQLVPYSSHLLAVCVLISLVSFIRKVLVGKRIYSIELYDILLVLLIVIIYLSLAFTSVGSGDAQRAVILTVLILGYVPASNMPVNRRLFDCVSGALTSSALPVSLHSIISYAINYSFEDRVPSKAFFDCAQMLAVYLFAVAVFALYLSIKRVHKRKKFYYFTVFFISVIALATTECFEVMLAVGLGVFAIAILNSREISKLFILVLLALPFSVFLLSGSALGVLDEVFSMSVAFSERGELISDALSRFFADPFFGCTKIGYADTVYSIPNLYVALACRLGGFALFAVLLILVLRLMHLDIHKKLYSGSSVGFYVDSATIASFSILIIGSFTDIFLSPEMVYFFVVVFAIGSAALRVSRKEKEERLSYYKDLGTSDSAEIDVTLAR